MKAKQAAPLSRMLLQTLGGKRKDRLALSRICLTVFSPKASDSLKHDSPFTNRHLWVVFLLPGCKENVFSFFWNENRSWEGDYCKQWTAAMG